jgi:hypothetical protein
MIEDNSASGRMGEASIVGENILRSEYTVQQGRRREYINEESV